MGSKKNIPEIRFKGFEGEWEEQKLGEVAKSFEYGLNAAATDYDGVNKYLRITDIDDESHEFKTDALTSPNINFNNADNYRLIESDLLFARTGASVGKTYYYKNTDGLVYFAGFLIRARIKSEYNTRFIFQNTLTNKYDNFIRLTSQRSGQPGVNAQEYSEYSLMIPHLKEQTQIGTYFQNLDSLISLHQCKYNKLLTVKKAMLGKMFPKEGADVPEIRFNGFEGKWEKKKLGEVVEFIGTGKSTYVFKNEKSESNCYAILGSRSVIGYDSVYDYSGNFILTARVGENAGQLYKYSGQVKITDNTVFIKSENLDYMYYLLTNFNLQKLSFGTGQPLIKASELNNLQLMFPLDNAEQTKIGTFFQNLDTLITQHQKELEKLKNLKKACLEKMFV